MLTPEAYTLLTDYLTRYYDAPLYQQHGMSHPVIWYSASPEQATDIDSILGHFNQDLPSQDKMSFYNYAHLHTIQNSGRNLFNGTTYIMRRLRTNPLRIDGGFGTYFDMLATCGALEIELLDVIERGMVRLPMRSQYHRDLDAQTSLTSGKGRSATIGGVMLTVFNDEGVYKAIVSQRTAQHATDPNALHLLPAFIFQPMDKTRIASDWTFKHHLYREYLEELVGMEEGDPDMNTHPAFKDLQAMEADGQASIQLTGIAFNMLTLRPEIGAVLVVHDPTWWQAMQTGERGYSLQTPEATRASLRYLPIADDEIVLSHLPENYHLTMVPQAIPALWQGIESARLLIATYDG
ncbi:MAG: hypothetical protein AAF846_20285 [Chloroflexota bacterium]